MSSHARPLHVITLSEVFSHLWGDLARDAGISVAIQPGDAPHAPASGAVVVIAARGHEADLLQTVRAQLRNGPVAVAAVESRHRLAVEAMRAGASDYFTIPDETDGLRAWVREESQRGQRAAEFGRLEAERFRFEGILGSSPALRAALERAARVIPRDTVTILLRGETGTGKELFAKAIHYNGPRQARPFVAVNCAALPPHLLESELFGHERGAFTGAHATKPGLFEVADHGTLFLDEIGHLDLDLQGKLLRALEERSVRRVGGSHDRRVDIRVIAATHVDLSRAAASGTFRADLFYRLNVMPIVLPPLRDRGEDVLHIAEHIVASTAERYGLAPPRLSTRAVQHLRTHPWPGNVRELRNAIERATLLAVGPVIDAEDLELEPATGLPTQEIPFPATLDTLALAAARAMLVRCGGNKSDASRRLGISRQRLMRLLAAAPGDGGMRDA